MSFISIEFLILFGFTFILYYIVNDKKYQKNILLLSSLIFVGYYHISFLITALTIIISTFFLGKLLAKNRDKKNIAKLYLASIILIVIAWGILRYPAIPEYLSALFLQFFSISKTVPEYTFLVPIGISFYTFQAIAYLTNIYWEEIEPEDNLCDFGIYMFFFMKFLSGPIERPNAFLIQLKEKKDFDYDTVTYGLKLFFIGIMKKTIIADNLAPSLNEIYASLDNYTGIQLVLTSLIYPIQLYADFSGYTDMALGGAMMFGFKLTQNFNRPFISKSITELWQRWHISLSSWVRDYIYMPLSTTLRNMGSWGISLSLFISFLIIGIWHGSSWNFVIYGLLQGIFVVYEMNTSSFRNRLTRTKAGTYTYNTLAVITTYLLFAFSLIFFRTESIDDAWYFVSHLSIHKLESIKELRIGISDRTYIITGITFTLLLIYEHFNSKKDLLKKLSSRPILVRWTIYFVLILALLSFGHFSDDSFIYVMF